MTIRCESRYLCFVYIVLTHPCHVFSEFTPHLRVIHQRLWSIPFLRTISNESFNKYVKNTRETAVLPQFTGNANCSRNNVLLTDTRIIRKLIGKTTNTNTHTLHENIFLFPFTDKLIDCIELFQKNKNAFKPKCSD